MITELVVKELLLVKVSVMLNADVVMRLLVVKTVSQMQICN